MPHAENTVTISRPLQEVFDYLADGTHNKDWRDGVLEIERTSADNGQGATYRQVLAGPGGRRIDGDYQITVFDPPRRLEFQVTAGPASPGHEPACARPKHERPRHRLSPGRRARANAVGEVEKVVGLQMHRTPRSGAA